MKKIMNLFPLMCVSFFMASCGSGGSNSTSSQGDSNSIPKFKEIGFGYNFLCGVTTDNKPSCIGYDNNNGQNGNGSTKATTKFTSVSNLNHVDSVRVGEDNACFINNGEVFCSGDNAEGQLGNGTRIDSHVPVKVTGISNVKDVVMMGLSTCALTNNDELYCWGDNSDWNDIQNPKISLTPIKMNTQNLIFNSIFSSPDGFCAVSNDKNVYCVLMGKFPKPNLIQNLTDVKSIVSNGFTYCALKNSGEAWCWGSGKHGELGNGSNADYTPIPVQVLNVNNFNSLAISNATVCGTTTDAKAYCWGDGSKGALGNGNTSNYFVPTQVQTDKKLIQISGKMDSFFGLDELGSLYYWGTNATITPSEVTHNTPVGL